jgi:DNA-binding beta-propeller fold protein YncE
MSQLSLQLLYAFTASENPIVVSTPDGSPAVIDLAVSINTPSPNTVAMKRVKITIPFGNNTAGDLSSAASLPQPTCNNQDWNVTVSGSDLVLLPASPTSAFGGSSVIVTLPQITVNETSGSVPITIIETPPSGGSVTDASTYSIVKQPNNCPIVSFTANPPAIKGAAIVMLFWTCNDLGPQYTYAVGSNDAANPWSGGTDLSPQDGINGIATPTLYNSTQFYLNVLKSDGSVAMTIDLEVPMVAPTIYDYSYLHRYFGGYLYNLYWEASQSAYCEIDQNGTPVLLNGPVNTMNGGCYQQALPGPSGPINFSVTAYDQSGTLQITHNFREEAAPAVTTIPADSLITGLSISPDNKFVYVTTLRSFSSIDLTTMKVTTTGFPSGGFFSMAAFSPDGTKVYFEGAGSVICVGDLATMTIDNEQIPCQGGIFQEVWCLAVSPDGNKLLASVLNPVPPIGMALQAIDIPSRTILATLNVDQDVFPINIVITPDGKTGLVLTLQGQLLFFDMASYAFRSGSVSIFSGDEPGQAQLVGIAITTDNKFALCADCIGGRLVAVDIAAQAIAWTISVGPLPSGVVISPDGRLVLVCNMDQNAAILIDLAKQTPMTYTLPTASQPQAIAISGDCRTLAIGVGQGEGCAVSIYTQIASQSL